MDNESSRTWLEKIKIRPNEINNIPNDKVTREMLEYLVLSGNFKLIPVKFIDKELAAFYIIHNRVTFIIRRIPEIILRERDIQLLILKYCPSKFYVIKSCDIFIDILEEAFNVADISLIRYIDKNLLTDKMCETAYIHNKDSFKYIPNKFKSVEMCIDAVVYNRDNIAYIPKSLLSTELVETLQNKGVEIPAQYLTLVVNTSGMDQQKSISESASYIPDERLGAYPITNFKEILPITQLTNLGIKTLYDLDIYLSNIAEVDVRNKNLKFTASYNRFANTLKIIKCIIFGEDPQIFIDNDELTVQEGLDLLGISPKHQSKYLRMCEINYTKTFKELIDNLFYPGRTLQKKFYVTQDSAPYTELKIKYFAVHEYNEKKANSVVSNNGMSITDIVKRIHEINQEISRKIEEREILKNALRQAREKESGITRNRKNELKGDSNDDK